MKQVHVAVGVVFDEHGNICIARRPEGKHLAGYWEFPGGKVESGEDVSDALQRELKEELDIFINRDSVRPLIKINFEYPEKHVCLDVQCVEEFEGSAQGMEAQEVLWVSPSELDQYEFPEANKAIISAIHQLG